MASEKEFRHESIQDTESIIKYLTTFSEGFQKGEIEFRSGTDEIIIRPTGLIQMEIKAKNRDRKSKLSIKFSWKEAPVVHGNSKLQISPADLK